MQTELPFSKYHGLGNSYLVVDALAAPGANWPALARRMCDVNYGIGSDGVLISTGTAYAHARDHALRIFNPDGSEAEKSGNGLRIFARWLWDAGRVGEAEFSINTPGGDVTCRVLDGGGRVRVAMGRVVVNGPVTLHVPAPNGREEAVTGVVASIGNPHFVIVRDGISRDEACALGPAIERHAHFPARTNVQFVRVRNRAEIEIEIWERGAGYTLSSGSSSCAAAGVCAALGLVDDAVTVHTRGGRLAVQLATNGTATLEGPVEHIATGTWRTDFVR